MISFGPSQFCTHSDLQADLQTDSHKIQTSTETKSIATVMGFAVVCNSSTSTNSPPPVQLFYSFTKSSASWLVDPIKSNQMFEFFFFSSVTHAALD